MNAAEILSQYAEIPEVNIPGEIEMATVNAAKPPVHSKRLLLARVIPTFPIEANVAEVCLATV